MARKVDKKAIDSLIKNLEKLGLSEKEARIYLYLLERSAEVGSSKIVMATSLHGQYVYAALESLENKGLVKHVIKSNRKKWSANPPLRLESLVEEKRMVANEIRDSLESLFVRQHEQDFEIYQGEDQFIANEFRIIREAEVDSFIDIIGGEGSTFARLLGEEREIYNKESIAKNINIRFIGSENQRDYLEKTKSLRVNFDFRIMSGFGACKVSTSIYPNCIQFQIYGDPILVFKVKSEEIAKDYKIFFDSIWELCGKNSE